MLIYNAMIGSWIFFQTFSLIPSSLFLYESEHLQGEMQSNVDACVAVWWFPVKVGKGFYHKPKANRHSRNELGYEVGSW